jgi:BolA protein
VSAATGVENEIRARLAVLRPDALELIDESAAHIGHAGARPEGQTHWRLRIASPAFAGKSTVARHRMVYAALGEMMQHPIHALAIRAETPDEAHHSRGK